MRAAAGNGLKEKSKNLLTVRKNRLQTLRKMCILRTVKLNPEDLKPRIAYFIPTSALIIFKR